MPLAKQCSIRTPKRVARIVDARGFGRRAIELNNLEVPATAQIPGSGVTDIVATDEETAQALRNGVDLSFQVTGEEMRSVPENAALSMIAGFHQTDRLAVRQD